MTHNIASFSFSALLASLALGATLGACSNDAASDCTPGAAGCECQGGLCLGGLVCENGVCLGSNNDEVGDSLDTGDATTATTTETDTSNGCDPGLTSCDGMCVDTLGHPDHCGGCNSPCAIGEVCDAGVCTLIEDCTEQACVGFSYCDLATHLCMTGCAFDNQCNDSFVCDLATHTCNCPVGEQECDGACISEAAVCPMCGNGSVDGAEECDGSDFDGATCLDFGFVGGSLGCSGCMIVTDDCTEAPPVIADGFETGNFQALPWIVDPPAWSVSTTMPHAGNYVAQSGTIGNNQISSLALVVLVGGPDKANITFWHRESTELNNDKLDFYIDGALFGSWSGTTNWTQSTFPIFLGELNHAFEWKYKKNGSITAGSDKVYIDDISFGP